ncbi:MULTISPECIES: hypothetical protein [Microvirga]|uniref:hypothetical protein n=1 Tax=Microvirga TaxID=186650 RepID=UPI0021C7DE2A|nr:MULTISPECIES: hypothetical protein [unclassified Microvirga]
MNSTTNGTARVIEVDGVTAGIAVPEEGGFRFFSSGGVFDALDGRRFRSLRQIAGAVHDRWRRSIPPESRAPRPPPADPSADRPFAVPGPFLLPV